MHRHTGLHHVRGDDVVERVSCQLVTLAVSNQHFATDDPDDREEDVDGDAWEDDKYAN